MFTRLVFAISSILLLSEIGTAQPNLTPYQPAGWSDKIVVSKVTGTNTDGTGLLPTDTLYIDWAVVNNGTAPTAVRFYSELYVDNVLRATWFTDPPLNANFYTNVVDFSLGTLAAGTHTVRIITDTTGVIVEGSESDNQYTKTITVGNPSTLVLSTISTTPAPPVKAQQFSFTLAGSGFDPSTVEVFFLGPGCGTPTSCVVSNGVLTTKTATVVAGPATLADGGFSVQARNTSNGSVSNALSLFVAAQSGAASRALVLLVDFPDKPGQTPRSFFQAMLFGNHPPEAPQGSVRDYYKEVSYGTYDLDGTVNNATIAWIRLPQNSTYYSNGCYGIGDTANPPCSAPYPQNAQKMVEDAIVAARNLGLDFGPFDVDNNGFVDALFVIHAGSGGEFSGNRNDIWSHSWTTTVAVNTGSINASGQAVYVRSYTTEPEFLSAPGDLTMGVFAHEYGHTRWGLPDLYDIDYTSQGIGNWSLMAGGIWNGSPQGSSPSHLDAWSKYFVGFVNPAKVTTTLTNEPIAQAETVSDVYQLLNGSAIAHTGEYFLIENRQRTGFDTGLPASGLLIWHIDEAQGYPENGSENYPGCSTCSGHYKVQLVQADNRWDLEKNLNRGDAGDPYPGTCGTGTCNTAFTGTTAPNSRLWNGQATGVTITNISTSSSTMTATLSPTSPSVPALSISKTHSGNFTQGQQNAQYTLVVSNGASAAATSGTVTVTETVPSGLTLVSMFGTGWTCTGNTCTRGDILTGGLSYPAITVTVNVLVNASSPQVNAAAVSGGGAANASTTDSTTVLLQPPDLTITKTHIGNFTQGQTGASYTITVTNNGAGLTSGTVTVIDSVPTGLTATAIGGSGWNCTQPSGPCTRSDALAASASYPAIALSVNVASTAPASVTNTATVSGGGETNTNNDTANDLTIIAPAQVAAPTFNPPAGNYGSTQSVTINTATSGASIRYTTDGSLPTSSLGTLFNINNPVSVGSNLTLKAIAYKTGMADSTVTSGSYVITGGGGGNSAAFVKTDTTTQGSWKAVYGTNGYNVFDDQVSYPAYVAVTPAGQQDYVWAASTNDVRGLLKALSPTDRIAATWYTSGSFTIDLNFTDGVQHQLAVYCLDWDAGGGRTQSLSILDGATNALLNSQNVSTFQNGAYVVWNLTGHVILKVTNSSPINAVISGLFFDAPNSGSNVVAMPTFLPPAGNYGSTQSVTISTATSGASIRYTTDGTLPTSSLGTVFNINNPVSVGSNLTLKAIAYKSGMTDSTVASAVYTIQAAAPTFLPPAGTYGSTQSVTINTATSGASIRYTTDGSLPTSSLGTLFNINNPVSVGSNLTLKAIAYKTGMADSTVTSGSYVITGGGGGNSAAFVKTDTTTQGSWKAVYGTNGYNVFDDQVSYPAYVAVTPAGQQDYVWAASTNDVRGLLKALSPTDRIAATWYTSGSFTIDLNFTDGVQHQLAVYCLDWDAGGGRTQSLSILDGATNALLNSQNVSTFQNGAYVVWNLTGHVILKVTNSSPINAVISGLFFDAPNSGSNVVAMPTFLPPAGNYGSTQSVTISTATSGASIRYTTDGTLPTSSLGTVFNINNPVSVGSNLTLKAIAYKSGMTDSTVASAVYTIQAAAPTFLPPAGTYGSTQSVTINTATSGASIRYTTDGSLPTSSLGTLFNINNPVSVGSNLTLKAIAYKTGMADSTVTSGSYVITGGGGGNSAAFVKTDTTTQGSWKAVYGTNGYNVFDDQVSYPAYVAVTPAGQQDYVWAASTNDVRGLLKALSPTDRIAATWYTSGSFTIDLNFTDGVQHQLAVYCLDWDAGGGRTQSLSILDGATNALLNSQNVSTFQNGAYVVWNLTGHVILKVTNSSPINAVISGLFFN